MGKEKMTTAGQLCFVNKPEEYSTDPTQWPVSLTQDSELSQMKPTQHPLITNKHVPPISVFAQLYWAPHPNGRDLNLLRVIFCMCR